MGQGSASLKRDRLATTFAHAPQKGSHWLPMSHNWIQPSEKKCSQVHVDMLLRVQRVMMFNCRYSFQLWLAGLPRTLLSSARGTGALSVQEAIDAIQ